jgi:hypothetical protein
MMQVNRQSTETDTTGRRHASHLAQLAGRVCFREAQVKSPSIRVPQTLRTRPVQFASLPRPATQLVFRSGILPQASMDNLRSGAIASAFRSADAAQFPSVKSDVFLLSEHRVSA